MGDTTQEMILDQLKSHGQELRQIHSALEQLIRVEERQAATDTRIEIMTKRCDQHDERIRALESVNDKKGHVINYIERGMIWVVAAIATFFIYRFI